MIKRSLIIVALLCCATLLGYILSTNEQEGRCPSELTANRVIVYMEEDILLDALKAHEADGWYEYSKSFFFSSVTISAAKGKESEFRKLVNREGIAAKTSQITNNVIWDEEKGVLTLEKESGGLAVPVWLLAILQDKQVLIP